MSDMLLTFGKHNGKKLSEVPLTYVEWLSQQDTICGKKDIPQAARAYLASIREKKFTALQDKSYQEAIREQYKFFSSKKQEIPDQARWELFEEYAQPFILSTAKNGKFVAVKDIVAHLLPDFPDDTLAPEHAKRLLKKMSRKEAINGCVLMPLKDTAHKFVWIKDE